MTGTSFLELVLLSMGWLFFLGGLALNYGVLVKGARAKTGDTVPSSLGFVPGVVGSLAVFFTLPALARYGVQVPWPWLWILLPLVVDPFCLGGLLLLLYRKITRS